MVSKFTDAEKTLARELLKGCPVPRDQLPYTPNFDRLFEQFKQAMPARQGMAANEFWRLLSSAAKQGGLAKTRQ